MGLLYSEIAQKDGPALPQRGPGASHSPVSVEEGTALASTTSLGEVVDTRAVEHGLLPIPSPLSLLGH